MYLTASLFQISEFIANFKPIASENFKNLSNSVFDVCLSLLSSRSNQNFSAKSKISAKFKVYCIIQNHVKLCFSIQQAKIICCKSHFRIKRQFLPVGSNLPPRLTPSLLLIYPLGFIFYNILPALNNMMTIDFPFLPKAAFLSICSWSHFYQNF